MNPKLAKLHAILEKQKAEKLAADAAKAIKLQEETKHIPFTAAISGSGSGNSSEQSIALHPRQQEAIDLSASGREFVLIGAAGSGKTFTTEKIVSQLANTLGINLAETSKDDKTIAIVSYTRRAVRNSAKALSKIGAQNCVRTAHKFLEYGPVYIDYQDEEGNWKKTMRFLPGRTAENPIHNCRLVIIEEASMLDYDGLYQELRAAAPNATFLYIGDLFQLPPVFGKAVLGYKLAELPVVELTHIYRQAMDSPIVAFQHNFTLKGKVPTEIDLAKISESATAESGLEFVPFKKDFPTVELYCELISRYIIGKFDSGEYCPNEDTILIPFNKKFGSTRINELIAQHLGERREAEVWEIFAGRNKKYFAVDDFVMYEKQECVITAIEYNPNYFGPQPRPASSKMTRDGILIGEKAANLDSFGSNKEINIDALLDLSSDDDESVTQAASAIVHLKDFESGQTHQLKTTGEIANLDFGYCMSIHKAQGSEWRRVWLILHRAHSVMLSRELLYTGMTRAKEKLTVLYSPNTKQFANDHTIAKCIQKARIPGKTWQEKVKYFQQNDTFQED